MQNERRDYAKFDELPPAQGIRSKLFDWIVDEHIDLTPGTNVVDLGAGPCLFAKKFRDRGCKVTAVDARTVRKPSDSDLDGIEFREEDVRQTDLQGFDIISNLGLFYHLTLDDQVSILKRTPASTTSIIETQIYEQETVTDLGREHLRTEDDFHGYTGATFVENDNPMASWGNEMSFWHTHQSMLKLFENCGFKHAISIFPHYMSKYASRAYYVIRK